MGFRVTNPYGSVAVDAQMIIDGSSSMSRADKE